MSAGGNFYAFSAEQAGETCLSGLPTYPPEDM